MQNFTLIFLLIGINANVALSQSNSSSKELLMPICTSSCVGTLGENIFPNGDFGAGIPNILPTNPNLAPGFTYQLSPPPNDGYYCITNNTTPWGSFAYTFWIDIEDNGPEPNGYMMVVNANYQPGLFYQNTVEVCENTVYELSIDIISLIKYHVPNFILPNISFLVDGNVVCETGNIPQDEQWRTVRFSFVSQPGQNTTTIELRNNAPGGGGNDLAIDNISLRACGPSITVPDSVSFCTGAPITIPSVLSNTPYNNPVYLWQTLVNGFWEDIANSNNDSLEILNPIDGSQFRLIVASALPNLALPNCRVVSSPVKFIVHPGPVINTTVQNVSCAGAANATVSAEVVGGGTAPFVYSWNSGDTAQNISNLSAGTYSVTVTDVLGCIGMATVTLTEPPLLTVIANNTNTTCFGIHDGLVMVSAAGGASPYSYSWSNGQTNDTIAQMGAGTYQVTVTDANACTKMTSVIITEPPLLSSSTTVSDVSCFGLNDAIASVSVAGGVLPYAFSWSNGQTSDAIAQLGAGTYQVTVTDANACTKIASVIITEPPLLNLSTTVTDVSCFGHNVGTAALLVAGGVLPYSYSWSNGQTSDIIAQLEAGDYQITVTDANACTKIASVTITEPPLLSLSATVSNVSCFGLNNATAALSVAGGVLPYSYSWSNGQTSDTIAQLGAGTYQVTVTDANACTMIASVIVTESPLLSLSATVANVSCFGLNDAIASVSAAGGVLPYSYSWSNGQNSDAIAQLGAGTYQVTVTDANTCTKIASVTIMEPPLLSSSTTATDVSCFGHSDATAVVSVAGGVLPYDFSWNNGQTSAAISQLGAGTYLVTVTDANACTRVASVTVSEPPILSSSTTVKDVSCFGLKDATAEVAVAGGVLPYSFSWSNGQTSDFIAQLGAGTYLITVTDLNACTIVTSVIVTEPPALVAGVAISNVNCFGGTEGSVQASVNGGVFPYTYLWNNGANTTQISNLPIGNYTLSLTDGNGCLLTISAQVSQPPPLAIQINKRSITCFGDDNGALDSQVSGGVMPYLLHWSSGQTTADISGLSAGSYTIIISDAHGCTLSASEYLAEPIIPTVQLGLDLILNLGDIVDLQAVVNIPDVEVMDYTWSGTEAFLQCTDCDIYSFQPLSSGCQQVLVRSKKGCIASDTLCYKIRSHRRVYPPNVFSPNGDGQNDFFTIFSDDGVKQILSLKIFNRWGGQIYQANNIKTNDEPRGWDGTFKGQELNIDVFVWVAEIEFIDGEIIRMSGDVTLVR
ncbi:MAG: gliding motility-associated C-terminal domain-containing protein [Saprospiraceae bacterium]